MLHAGSVPGAAAFDGGTYGGNGAINVFLVLEDGDADTYGADGPGEQPVGIMYRLRLASCSYPCVASGSYQTGRSDHRHVLQLRC